MEKSQLKTVLEAYFEDVPDLTDMEKAEILNTELETLSKYGTHTIKVYEIYNGSFKQINTTSGKTVAELYDGKNNQNEQNYNENAMHIGDWIEYDAGNGYNTERIFTGTTTGTINTHYPSTPRDWSIYENTYAKGNSARTLRKNDLDTWYNRYIDSMISDLSDYEKIENGYWDDEIQDYIEPRGIPNSIENKMISIMSNGYNYSLTDVGDNDRALTWSTAGRVARLNDGEDDGVYGITILVALKNDIKFNETPTKLQKDGYSYNKWIISDN